MSADLGQGWGRAVPGGRKRQKKHQDFSKSRSVCNLAELLTLGLEDKIEVQQFLFSMKAAWKSCSLNSA